VYVTLQDPEDRVHVVELNVPVLLVVKVTVPVGVPLLDVTVAVQVEGVLSGTLDGVQFTVVVVGNTETPTATVKLPVLPVCTLLPP
jgi:hypothetical protein